MFNASKLKEVRISHNMTQKQVADILNISRSSYAMWESNNNIIPIKRLITYCNYFNVSLDYIFEFSTQNYLNLNDYNKDMSIRRIKELRLENKITQNKIALFLHIDQPTWSLYENGRNIIGTPFLYMICKKYKISADYLLGRINFPKYLKDLF